MDWEKTKKDNGEVNRRYMTNSTDNQTIVANDKGELQGVKKGDRVVSGNVLGEQLAECMAYVISKKMGKNLCAILSIASSSDYNEKTMGDDYSQNKDNIIYHLRETFGVNNVLTDPKFFQKVSHLLEINRDILKSAKNQTEKNEICNNIKDAYQSKIEQYLKVLNKQKNSDELFKLLYCNMDENPNILDDLGFADLSFLKDTNYNVDLDNCQERMFGDLSIVSLYEDMVEADKKWEIKSIPENVKKYMSFFLKCSFDGTIKTITMIKNEIKDKTISPEDENAYFNAEDADKRGIVIFDDNYSSGATTKEAARVLVDFLNINPNRVLCVTPGYMASKK